MNKTPSKLLWRIGKNGLWTGSVLLLLLIVSLVISSQIPKHKPFYDGDFRYWPPRKDKATGEGIASLLRVEGKTSGMEEFAIPSTANNKGKTYRITRFFPTAFRSCSNLARITIPEGITRIGEGAFQNCKSLKNVYFKRPPADNFIRAFDRKTILHYIEGTPGWTTPEWNGFTTRIWVPES
ncbi:MAG: leucine-rich repeat domain-containing protein [Verrucomicrobia bacterium]|nr:leucine-rich repeat domain-containing protein [Verrucomicrobiota bacterium]